MQKTTKPGTKEEVVEKEGVVSKIIEYLTEQTTVSGPLNTVTDAKISTKLELCLFDGEFFLVHFRAYVGREVLHKDVTYHEVKTTQEGIEISKRLNRHVSITQQLTPEDKNLTPYTAKYERIEDLGVILGR